LRAVGDVFGVEFPVYQIITKCDAIPFFPDFFRRLPEPEANQILGCHSFPSGDGSVSANDATVEDKAEADHPVFPSPLS